MSTERKGLGEGKEERRTFLGGRRELGDRGEYSPLRGSGILDLALRGRNNADVTRKDCVRVNVMSRRCKCPK